MSKIDPWGFSEVDDNELKVKDDLIPEYKKGRYQIHIRVYDKSILHHRTIRTNDLGITVKTDIGEYALNTNWLFKEKRFILLRLWDRIRGVKQNFRTFYEKDKPEFYPINLSFPKVSGGHLNTIRQSQALKEYLISLLQTKFDTRMLIIILIAIGMFGVYFLYSMGYIDLSSILKR